MKLVFRISEDGSEIEYLIEWPWFDNHIIRPSILRVSNVFFQALEGLGKIRETSKMRFALFKRQIIPDFQMQ